MSTQQPCQQTISDRLTMSAIELNPSVDLANDAQGSLSEATAKCVARWKRIVQLTLAGLFFVLGVLGAFLPLLPATPFLLLASYFLSKSSPRLNRRLLRSRMFGRILSDWQERGGIRRSVRIKAVAAVVVAVTATLVMSDLSARGMIAVVCLAQIGIIVVLRLPSAVEPESQRQLDYRTD
ncbi:MAG: YbaN family protein [Planctomycetota bacterium]|jgi:uncharacterized membrane protein YbaN (DUF454 family)